MYSNRIDDDSMYGKGERKIEKRHLWVDGYSENNGPYVNVDRHNQEMS